MSLVDDVFGSLPGPLISEWGVDGAYIKTRDSERQYNPETGTFSGEIVQGTRISVRLIPLRIRPEEVNGEVQLTDLKFLISGDVLGDYFPKVEDWISYTEAGVTRTAKVLQPLTHRGSFPILHSIIARAGAMPAIEFIEGVFEVGVFEVGVFL